MGGIGYKTFQSTLPLCSPIQSGFLSQNMHLVTGPHLLNRPPPPRPVEGDIRTVCTAYCTALTFLLTLRWIFRVFSR